MQTKKESQAETRPSSSRDTDGPRKASPPAYADQTGLTDKKLNFGLWYILHLKRLRKALIGFLIAVSVFGWGYFFYGFVYYIFVGMKEDQALVDNAANVRVAGHEYFESNQPEPLQTGDVQTLANGSAGTYDFLLEAKNPNPRHWAEFTYTFRVNGEELSEKKDFILPGEEKIIISLSEESEATPYSAEFKINKIAWHPVKAKEIPDWRKFKDEHLNIAIENPKFDISGDGQNAKKTNFANVQFAAANKTAYNYWSVDFLALLYQGSRIISLSSYTEENFMSGESHDISLSWATSASYASEVKIIPRLNIMRNDIYMDFEGQPGPGQRD
ncbi:MAG: hypothetical protein WC745_03890 [Patescibacteria group bacterium]